MSYASVTNVESTWTPKLYPELTKDGKSLLNPLIETSTSVSVTGTLDPRVSHTRVDTTGGAVTISLGATAALMRDYVGKRYTIYTNDGGNLLTVSCPTGAIMFGGGKVDAVASVVGTLGTTPACIEIFVHSITHVQIISMYAMS